MPNEWAALAGAGGPSSVTEGWRHALVALPMAALLGAVLAFRPLRRGTPKRDAAVIQTQIVLACVGAAVMIVVGASLARAFGIVGVASLIRYRNKVSDPKDAAVMLATLAAGLASGVGIYVVAAIFTGFVLVLLWVLESFEPEIQKVFLLRVKSDGISEVRPQLDAVLRQNVTKFELRTSSPDEASYEVHLPIQKRTDRVSSAIAALRPDAETKLEWEEK